jgi:hypothetical protein
MVDLWQAANPPARFLPGLPREPGQDAVHDNRTPKRIEPSRVPSPKREESFEFANAREPFLVTAIFQMFHFERQCRKKNIACEYREDRRRIRKEPTRALQLRLSYSVERNTKPFIFSGSF